MSEHNLSSSSVQQALASLQPSDALLQQRYPGDVDRRQPVHTVYVPGHLYTATTPREWGDAALEATRPHGGVAGVCEIVGLGGALADEVAPRVEAKLATEPIEDLRVDFEDGFGERGDEAEDAAVVAAARQILAAGETGQLPPFIGTRFKCFEEATAARGIRTLDLFVSTLAREGGLPDGLVLTFPKVSTVGQVETMVSLCEQLEQGLGLPAGRLGFEVQVETPQIILGPDGDVPLPRVIHAGRGRVTSLHYGTYDYSASMGISAAYQSMEHPVADQAKAIMQLAVAGTGVHLSDGSTNILPLGDDDAVRAAWALHARLVRRSLASGIYQGWDLHPAQLPTRFIASYAFYRQGFHAAASRLRAYVRKEASTVLDEPATARALARFLHRGFVCGAIDADELRERVTLEPEQLEALARPRSVTDLAD